VKNLFYFGRYAILSAAMIFCVASSIFADVIEDQLAGLDAAILETKTHYGMEERKEEFFGVSIPKLREKYRRLIQTATTLEEDLGLAAKQSRTELSDEQYEQLLIAYAAEFRDGHFNVIRNSTLNHWTVGIYAANMEGQYIVTGFTKLFDQSGASIEPKIGDRIIAVNGEPVEKIAARFEPSLSLATYASRMNLAYKLILNRSNRWVAAVKIDDEVRVRFQRLNPKYKEPAEKKEGETAAAEVSAQKAEPKYIEFEGLYHWTNNNDIRKSRALFPFDEPKADDDKFVFGFSDLQTYFSEGINNLKEKTQVIRLDEEFNAEIRKAKAKKSTGEKAKTKENTNLFANEPAQDAKLSELQEVSRVPVYIVRYKAKNIGVIRIPDYGIHLKEIRWLGEIMERLNELTDSLIIDQLDNGGGFVWSGAQVARLFADKDEFESITMNLKLSKTLLYNMELWDTDEEGLRRPPLPAPDNEIAPASPPKNPNEDLMPTQTFGQIFIGQKKIEHLRELYAKGEKYSGYLPYFGVQSKFKPGEHGRIAAREGKIYSKPILVLNDSRSASCGDFFPSIMQVNGRALVLGETSMGLGAPVYRAVDSMPGSELFMRCPFGDCKKPDNLPIENIGALPDLPRWITPADLVDSFKKYTAESLDVAVQLANGDSMNQVKANYFKTLESQSPSSEGFKAIRPIFDDLKTKLSADVRGAEVVAIYEDFFAKLKEKDSQKLKSEEWASVSLVLPKTLLQSDMILMSLRTSEEILDRLKQMRELPRFHQSEDLVVINYLIEKLPSLSGARRIVCYELMKSLPQYREPSRAAFKAR
jgi:C-terminal processing protease CtpA/Prc